MTEPELRFTGLDLAEEVVSRVAGRTAAGWPSAPSPPSRSRCRAIADAFSGRMGPIIENAVQMALGAFLRLAAAGAGLGPGRDAVGQRSTGRTSWVVARPARVAPSTRCCRPIASVPGWRGGSCRRPRSTRGCRPRRSPDSPSWSSPSSTSCRHRASPDTPTSCATSGRVGSAIWSGSARTCSPVSPPTSLCERAGERADWRTAGDAHRGAGARVPNTWVGSTIRPGDATGQRGSTGVDAAESLAVLLVPDWMAGTAAQLRSALQGRRAWSGPRDRGRRSSRRTAARCGPAASLSGRSATTSSTPTQHLVELVLGADREAADDLRRRALAPLWRSCAPTPRSGSPRRCDRGSCTKGPARCRRRRPLRARPDGPLPHDPIA